MEAMHSNKIMKRSEAIALGMKRYFTGKPCPHGHLTDRVARNGACVECRKKGKLKWYYKNHEHAKLVHKKWIEDNNDYVLAYAENYRKDNREMIILRDREIYKNHTEKRKFFSNRWKKNNPDMVRAANDKRRAYVLNAEGLFSRADLGRIAKAQKYKCAYCRKSIKKYMEPDHIIALSKGGSNWPSNIQATCRKCNVSKKDKDPIEFARYTGRLI